MASMRFMVAIFVTICCIWIQVSANGKTVERNMKLTWNEARNHCESIGKVLFDVMENMSNSLLVNILNETNQTWVAATVELSDFIKMPVCMRTTGLPSTMNKTFDTDIISNCLTFCNDYRYIGLKERDCFCIMNDTNLTRSKVCQFTCNNDLTHLCGGNESLSLYEKVDTNITRKIVPGFKECVYAQNNGSATELFTASCVGETADGGLCDSGEWTTCISGENTSECRSHKWTPVGSHLCRMNLSSHYRWNQVKRFCADIGGQLTSPTELQLNMENNQTYWLGIHRIATIHETKVKSAKEETFKKNYTHCAVARKEGTILMIEGEDCQAKHAIFCQESTEIPGKGSNSEHADGTIIYVVVAVSAMILGAIVITALAFGFRRRSNSQHTKVSATNSSSEHHVLLQTQSTNPPAKPLRKAHSTKEHVQISYENIVPVRSEQDVEMQQTGHSNYVEDNYDKIELDKEHRQENDIKEDGQRIYDHTFLCMTEDQYDLMDLSGDKIPVPGETYHRTTLTQKLETTNSVHGEDSQVNLERCKEVDNDCYTTMGHN